MIVTVILLIVGILLLGAGLFYGFKEKDDRESRKICMVMALIGAVLAAVMIVKIFVLGS